MPRKYAVEFASDLAGFRNLQASGTPNPFTPAPIEHVYVKLDLQNRFENARTPEDAKLFLRSIARAAMAAHGIVQRLGGDLLEVQGSVIHVGIPHRIGPAALAARDFASALHATYRLLFGKRSRVEGWRMSADAGKTLIVAGQGAHGDESWVSLGQAANRPAKHLHAQIELSEGQQRLKRFHAGFYDRGTRSWNHVDLDRQPVELGELRVIAERARTQEPTLRYMEAAGSRNLGVLADAAPLGTPGSPASPTVDRPHTHFGWVMRSDLDGFTARVEACLDDDENLRELAEEFYEITDAAEQFVTQHDETLAQLPWAGDNFTACTVLRTFSEYQRAIPRRLVELSMDFEKEMAESTKDGGFRGWSHGIAGGEVHGNSGGNIYLAGIEIANRRFLVGAGEGFGRSTQAFGDVNPDAGHVVLYEPDWERLDERYRAVFEPAVNSRGQQSTLYRSARTEILNRARARFEAEGAASTTVSLPRARTRSVAPRPYSE